MSNSLMHSITDVWSTGCVMAELMLGQPLFPGESGIDQLVEIIKVLGTPTREQIRTMNPNYMEHKFPQIKPHPFNKVSPPLCRRHVKVLTFRSRYSARRLPKPLISFLHFSSTHQRSAFRPSMRCAIHSSTNFVIRNVASQIRATQTVHPKRCQSFLTLTNMVWRLAKPSVSRC